MVTKYRATRFLAILVVPFPLYPTLFFLFSPFLSFFLLLSLFFFFVCFVLLSIPRYRFVCETVMHIPRIVSSHRWKQRRARKVFISRYLFLFSALSLSFFFLCFFSLVPLSMDFNVDCNKLRSRKRDENARSIG